MPQFIDSIEYTDTEGGKVALDGITSVSTVDASTVSVASAREAQHAVNADNATNANHAVSADSATNVTTNINGKAISSIFEDNGTTAKNATNASTANVANSVAQVGRLTKLWSGTWDGTKSLSLTIEGSIEDYTQLMILAQPSGAENAHYFVCNKGFGKDKIRPVERAFSWSSGLYSSLNDSSAGALSYIELQGAGIRLTSAQRFAFLFGSGQALMGSDSVTITEIWGVEATKEPE